MPAAPRPGQLNLPNTITILRALAAPGLVLLVAFERYGWALAAFVLAGLSDGLDGLLARRLEQRTWLGAVLDPIADKLVTLSLVLTLTLHDGPVRLPVWLCLGLVGRDALLLVAALLVVARRRSVDFRPSRLGKASTVAQIGLIALVLLDNVRRTPSPALVPLELLAVGLAVASGAGYLALAAAELGRPPRSAEQEQAVRHQQAEQEGDRRVEQQPER